MRDSVLTVGSKNYSANTAGDSILKDRKREKKVDQNTHEKETESTTKFFFDFRCQFREEEKKKPDKAEEFVLVLCGFHLRNRWRTVPPKQNFLLV